MEEVFIALIEKLTPVQIIAILGVVFFTALYVAPRIRRSKDGKHWYIYSQSYENNQDHQKKIASLIKEVHARIDDNTAWVQRTILFSQNFTLGERLAAGSTLEQLSGGWQKKDACYNGQARSVYRWLLSLEAKVNRNEYVVDKTRPVCCVMRDGTFFRPPDGDMRQGNTL